jgi:NADPH:quinone reductase-like Zn-dependent oxidoreductase
VKVHATTVTRSDCGWRSATPVISRFFTGLRGLKRRILGTEFAVQVAEVDDGVTGVRRRRPRLRREHLGGHAEYVSVLARPYRPTLGPIIDTQKN